MSKTVQLIVKVAVKQAPNRQINRVSRHTDYRNNTFIFRKLLILLVNIPLSRLGPLSRATSFVDPFRPKATSPGTTPTGDPGLVSAHYRGSGTSEGRVPVPARLSRPWGVTRRERMDRVKHDRPASLPALRSGAPGPAGGHAYIGGG